MTAAATRIRRMLLGAFVLTLVVGGPAVAAWNATSAGGSGVAKAAKLPTNAAPTLTRLGRDAKVTWPQATFRSLLLGTYSGGGYAIKRGGAAAGAGCNGLQGTGSTPSPSCTEVGLATGTYAYSVQTQLAGWLGTTSGTTSLTIPSPTLTFSPSTWTAPGNALNGSIDGFLDAAALTYRLDNAATGPVLTATLATFPTAPATAATTNVSVGCAPGTGSAHTVYAKSGADQAAGAFTFDFSTILCPTVLTSAVVGTTAGTAQAADTIDITFSQAVLPTTICSTLTAGGSTSTTGNLIVTIVDGGTGVNDTLTIAAPPGPATKGVCGATPATVGTVNFGTLDLGSANYATSGNVTFSGTTAANVSKLSLNGTATTLTITLGAAAGATAGLAPVGAIAKYTPDAAIRSMVGTLVVQGYMTSADRLL